jgi:hypothetical protein
MSSLKARQFLYKVSSLIELQKETFSHEEITKKINEIKYLVAQKRTPRFVLKKEIQFLEDELKTVLDLEKSLQKSRGQESTQVKLLKRKIDILKKRLSIAEDKELPKKVEKLSHLLGDLLAKYGTQEDIDLSNKLLSEVSLKKLKKVKKEERVLPLNRERVQALLDRVLSLKFELIRIRGLPHSTVTPELEEKLSMIEEKLRALLAKLPLEGPHVTETHVQVTIASNEVKHDLLFGAPATVEPAPTMMEIVPPSIAVQVDSELYMDLPLPPPPRIKG